MFKDLAYSYDNLYICIIKKVILIQLLQSIINYFNYGLSAFSLGTSCILISFR